MAPNNFNAYNTVSEYSRTHNINHMRRTIYGPWATSIVLLVQLWFFVAQHQHLDTIIDVGDEFVTPEISKYSPPRKAQGPPPVASHRVRRRITSQHVENSDKERRTSAISAKSRRLLVHLHIGKTGGTSLDNIGRRLARDSGRVFIGHRHFDWSFINELPRQNTDVITMLRNPVSRAVSHFYFSKNRRWTQMLKMRRMKLGEYLQDKEAMMQSRDLWYDGQAAISWLTGTHLAKWVGVNPQEQNDRERLAANATAMCVLAADRLDETLWFGIIEDLPRSMELLQHALGLSSLPEFPKFNAAKTYPKPTEWEREALASLMPQDMWLYEYGKRLFEARYQAMKTGVFVQPERPPIPDTWSCKSNRFRLDCIEGPLKGSIEKSSSSESTSGAIETRHHK